MRILDISRLGQAPEDQNSGDLADLWTDAKTAWATGVQGVAGIGDAVARPFRGEDDPTFAERLAQGGENTVGSDAYMAKLQREYSPARQQSEQNVQDSRDSYDSEAGKFVGTVVGLATNPRALTGRIVQSALPMVMSAGVGGMVGGALKAAGMGAKAIATGARLGAAAGEGIQSGAQNAYDAINYNVANGRGRYEGVGGAQAITAIGVGATSLLGGKIGGGIEAGLFNKEVRQGFQTGWRGTGRAALGEGAEEAVQSGFETVPQNIALDRPWNEGLGQNVGEGAIAGAAMGGGFHAVLRPGKPESLVQGANKSPEIPQTEQPVEAAQTNVPNNEAQQAPEPMPEPATVETPEPTPQQTAVNEAVTETPMAGTQPVSEPVVPQAPVDPKQQAAAQLEGDTADYRKTFGVLPVENVSPKQAKTFGDLIRNGQNPEFVRSMVNAAVAANKAAGTKFNPKTIIGTVSEYASKVNTPEELVKALEENAAESDAMNSEKGQRYADFFNAMAEAVRNPNADLASFVDTRVKARQQAALVKTAEAAQQQNARAEEAAKKAGEEAKLLEKPKVEAPVKKAEPVKLPTAKEWANMTRDEQLKRLKAVEGKPEEIELQKIDAQVKAAKEAERKASEADADKRRKAWRAKTTEAINRQMAEKRDAKGKIVQRPFDRRTKVFYNAQSLDAKKLRERIKKYGTVEDLADLETIEAATKEEIPGFDLGLDELRSMKKAAEDAKNSPEETKPETLEEELVEEEPSPVQSATQAVEEDAGETHTEGGPDELHTDGSLNLAGKKGAGIADRLERSLAAGLKTIKIDKNDPEYVKAVRKAVQEVEDAFVADGGELSKLGTDQLTKQKEVPKQKKDSENDEGETNADLEDPRNKQTAQISAFIERYNDAIDKVVPKDIRDKVMSNSPVQLWLASLNHQAEAEKAVLKDADKKTSRKELIAKARAEAMAKAKAELEAKATEKKPEIVAERSPLDVDLKQWNATATTQWCQKVTMDGLKARLQKKMTPGAEKLAKQVVYIRTASGYEAPCLPLKAIAETKGNMQSELEQVFTPDGARAIVAGIKDFQRAGLRIPDAYIGDCGIQINVGKLHQTSTATGRFRSVGATVPDRPTSAINVLTGNAKIPESSSTIFVWAGHAEAKEQAQAIHDSIQARTVGTHEMTHALEFDNVAKKFGEVRVARETWPTFAAAKALPAVVNSESCKVLYGISKGLMLADRLGISFMDALNKLQQTDPELASASLNKIIQAYNSIDEAKRPLFSEYFAYPQRVFNSSLKTDGPQGAAIALGEEWVATLNEVMLGLPEAAEVIKQAFPELAKIWNSIVKDLNANGGQNEIQLRSEGTGANNGANAGRSESTGERTFERSSVYPERKRGVQDDKSAAEREARVQKYIEEKLKFGDSEAKDSGLDPKVYETDEWKKVARAYAEAAVDKKAEDSRVGQARAQLSKDEKAKVTNPDHEAALEAALKKRDAAQQKELKARLDFEAFENSHRQKVESAPLPDQVVDQYPYDKWVAKIKNPTARGLATRAAHFIYKGQLGALFTRDLVDVAKKYVKHATDWMKANNAAAQAAREWQDKAVAIGQAFNKLAQTERDAINSFLERSVIEGKWFALPKNAPEGVAVTADPEFAKLSPAAKQVYKDVLAMGVEARTKYRDLAVAQTEKKYADRIERYPEKREDLEKERDKQIALVKKRIGETTEPYVALRRFGNFVVVSKTQAYVDAYQDYLSAKALAEAPGASPRSKLAMNERYRKVIELQQNGKDYIVEYAETPDEALARRRELEEETGGKASYFEREEFTRSEQLNLQQLLNIADKASRMADGVDGVLDKASLRVRQQFDAMATTMYIQSLSSTSAMKSRLHRRKVAGHSNDMIRAFMETASSESRLFGYMEHGADIRKAISAMRDDARVSTNRAVASTMFNEILKRTEKDLQPQSALASGAMRVTATWMLMTNPAFFVQNLMQPLMYSAAYESGRFGLWRPLELTAKQMVEVAKWIKEDGTLSDLDKLVADKKITADEAKMLKQMRINGLLDIGLSQEFGEFSRDSLSPAMKRIVGLSDKLAGAARKVEIINRAATALVAYRLEKGRQIQAGKSETEAHGIGMRFADHVLYETHGDYSSQNAPRYFKMNGIAKLVTQFRKFQLIQLGLFTRMLKQSLDKSPTEERKFARAGLRNTLMLFMAMTGLKGLPFYVPIAMALGLFAGGAGDDDEDYLRKTLADAGMEKPIIDAFLRGIPAAMGLDVSGKLGAGNTMSIFPYLDSKAWIGQNGEDDALKILAAIVGPWASLSAKFYRGAGYYWQGDYAKALENVLPNGIFSNGIKAMRIGLDGITSKNGDVMIPGEQFTFGDLLGQTLGLPTTAITRRNDMVGSLMRHEEAFNLKAKQIRYDYQQAVKDHNSAGRAAAMRAWQAMNAERRAQGFTMRPMQNLISSAKQQRQRERNAIGGVATNKSNRGFVKKLDELY